MEHLPLIRRFDFATAQHSFYSDAPNNTQQHSQHQQHINRLEPHHTRSPGAIHDLRTPGVHLPFIASSESASPSTAEQRAGQSQDTLDSLTEAGAEDDFVTVDLNSGTDISEDWVEAQRVEEGPDGVISLRMREPPPPKKDGRCSNQRSRRIR